MKSLVASLVLALVARTAGAQPGNTPPSDPDDPPPQQATRPLVGDEKSESTALWLSLGGTIASYTLWFGAVAVAQSENAATRRLAGSIGTVGVVGTLIAPSFGHWYAGKVFTRGFGIRLGGIALAFTGLVVAIGGCPLFGDSGESESSCGNPEVGVALVLAAGGLWIGGTVDDIVQAPRRVRRDNEARYALTPLITSDHTGLALVGSF